MTFPGTAIAKVGLSPRHNVVIPSFLAIFRSPSKVEFIFLFCASSAAHSAAREDAGFCDKATEGPATQNGALLLTQKTSRQQAVTPRFGGKLEKVRDVDTGGVVRMSTEPGVEDGADC